MLRGYCHALGTVVHPLLTVVRPPSPPQVLRGYLEAVARPLPQLDEMLVDDDLASVRPELAALRQEYAARSAPPGLFGLKNPLTGVPLSNPLRAIAEEVGVEWKD